MLPQIYLAQTPTSALRRRMLRVQALELRDRLARIDPGPCYVVLQLGEAGAPRMDVAILRPRSVIIGLLKTVDTPLDIGRDHPWLLEARQARAMLVAQLTANETAPPPWAIGTPIAAVIISPQLPAESQITLDVEDHRQRVKVLTIDELAPLAAMLQAGAQLDEAAMQQLVAQLGARHWHNGERLLFEIGLAPYRLAVIGRDSPPLTLLEGATVIGRRTAPLHYEYRLTITGDDSISADHAVLVCDGERVVLRDTSTNGTLITTADSAAQMVHLSEISIVPGTVIRIGETEVRLEQRA